VAVPDYQTLMRPLLEVLADGADHDTASIRAALTERFNLSESELEELIPSGRDTLFRNRVGWATTYLTRTGLIEKPRRAVYRIADRGRQVLAENPERVDLRVLAQFPEYREFRRARAGPDSEPEPPHLPVDQGTPEELIDSAYRELRAALAAELLDRVMEKPPQFFERLVLDVLHASGYGGGIEHATERLGHSGDEGVDGVIREDRLGLDLIYVQAKRWQGVVGRPEIQKFFGALHGQRATKGVFITTSTFSKDANDYADDVSPRVILIDGKQLAQLMIEHSVGVAVTHEYRLRRVDLDYFVDDDGGGE